MSADRIANGWPDRLSMKERVRSFFFPDQIRQFQCSLRAVEYYSNTEGGMLARIKKFWHLRRFRSLSIKLGFSIPENVFGPGLSIAHYGTIVVNPATRVGANCRLHTGVNIGSEAGYGGRAPEIGNNCYIGPGAKLYGSISIADNVAIGANAVVNKSVTESEVSIAGVPATIIGPVDIFKLIIPATEIVRSGFDAAILRGKAASEVQVVLREAGVSFENVA